MKGANMKHRIVTCILVLSASLLFTGCGATMIDLTEEQENEIALYSAKVVSKFNINQDKGIVAIPQEKEADTPADTTSVVDQTDSEPKKDDSSAQTNTPDRVNETDEKEQEIVSSKTLTEVMGIQDVSFLYRDAKVSSSYGSGDVYDLTPNKGNELLVVRIKAVNNSSSDAKIDMLKNNVRFTASFGSESVESDATLLLNDLTTYKGTLKAGKSKNMVILFQFPKGTVTDPSNIILQETVNSTTYQINLAGSKNK